MKRFAASKGDIYFAELDPVRGHEQAGRRPVVILSHANLSVGRGLVLAVPGTKVREGSKGDCPPNCVSW